MSSKTENRAKEILRHLLQAGKTSVDDLTSALGASPASIRRDLTRLEEKGLVHRTHGGAMLVNSGQMVYEPFRLDASFQIRADRFASEKMRIAKAAALMVEDEEMIGLSAGTTTTLIARQLLHRKNLHVITNAVNIGMELSVNPRLQTSLTGGHLRWAGAFTLVGPMALETLSSVVMHRVFLGVTGIDAMRGATMIQPEEAAIFRAMARAARQVIVVADSSKVSIVSPAVICPPNGIDLLITDDGISDDAQENFSKAGIRVIIAQ
jgi:DeoR family transcriptional regulator, aga operon transcriptional repressor